MLLDLQGCLKGSVDGFLVPIAVFIDCNAFYESRIELLSCVVLPPG